MEKVTYPNGETPKICIVGAGFSGMCAAIQLKKQLGLTSFTIFESNKDVGGTWLMNSYPGCACDVQSHLYSFSFELNPDWTEAYSSQPEIWRYMKRVADKHELYPHIKFETAVKTCTWNESKKQWRVVTLDKNSNTEGDEWFDLIINGPGALRTANIPDMFKTFKGPMIHSAEWDSSVNLKDKVVGIVGSGASAVQIVPCIAKDVKELHIFQRKPGWIVPRPQGEFSNFSKKVFNKIPLIMRLYRCIIFLLQEFLFPVLKKDTWMSRIGTRMGKGAIKKHFGGNEDMQKRLTPNYQFGCKRLLISNDYYPTLLLPNVTLHTEKIKEVAGHGIELEDGNLQNLDVLILATGYRVHDYFGPMEIYGRNSENILSSWKSKAPMTYYGIVSHSAPNQFILLGPNTALGHNTVVFMIECQVNFTINVIREMMKRNKKLVAVKRQIQDNFMSWIYKELKGTVWGSSICGSWYLNEAGVNTTLWPKTCTSYWNQTRNVNFDHFEFN